MVWNVSLKPPFIMRVDMKTLKYFVVPGMRRRINIIFDGNAPA